MLIQFESTRGANGGTSDSSRLYMRRWGNSLRNLMSSARAAFVDVCAVLAAFLLVTATGLGLAFALFVLIFCSF